tara:strand:+ start:1039 stop:1266 length:228 start_codon:yes stop_codon:yes gene_type:complete
MDFKLRLQNSGLLGASKGRAEAIDARLDYTFDCIKNMKVENDNCFDIEKKYLLIHLNGIRELTNEIRRDLEKIEL